MNLLSRADLPALPILTPRLLLRPPVYTDGPVIRGYMALAETVHYLLIDVPTEEDSKASLAKSLTQNKFSDDGDVLALAICMRTDPQQLIGDVKLFLHSVSDGQGSLGCVINPEVSGQGYASEAVTALLDLGFDHFGLQRIYAECDCRNKASSTVMEKVGMRREAHFQQCRFLKGEWVDEYTYALTKSEWQARRSTSATQHQGGPVY